MSKQIGPIEMRYGVPLELGELRALYEAADLHGLIVRALEQLAQERAALDAHVASQAFAKAADALHRLKGTVAFFGGQACGLDTLHRAERALRAEDSNLIATTLPAACRLLAAFAHALDDHCAWFAFER